MERAGAVALHFDVMDGSFVPNISIGIPVLESLRGITDLLLDVHLMIVHPERFVEPFLAAGADVVTFHIEAADDPLRVVERIHELGGAAGISLNPGTPVESLTPCLEACDLALIMSVEPGFGGQTFLPSAVNKLRWLDQQAGAPILEVDGGIQSENISECAAVGAQWFVAGSAIFKADDPVAAFEKLTRSVTSPQGEQASC